MTRSIQSIVTLAGCGTLFVAGTAVQSAAGVQPARKPAMTLELQGADPLDGVPQRVRLTLRNNTNDDLRLPEPGIGCIGRYGAFLLHVSVRPGTGVPPPEHGPAPCGAQPQNENPRHWITLAPGGYLDRWYSSSSLHLRDPVAGTFVLQAEYLPPALSKTLTQSLADESIVFPHSRLLSNRLTVHERDLR